MNRGSMDDEEHRGEVYRPFNEAPIHESGKSVPTRASRYRPLAFNEAPIHESGKSSAT